MLADASRWQICQHMLASGSYGIFVQLPWWPHVSKSRCSLPAYFWLLFFYHCHVFRFWIQGHDFSVQKCWGLFWQIFRDFFLHHFLKATSTTRASSRLHHQDQSCALGAYPATTQAKSTWSNQIKSELRMSLLFIGLALIQLICWCACQIRCAMT